MAAPTPQNKAVQAETSDAPKTAKVFKLKTPDGRDYRTSSETEARELQMTRGYTLQK